VPQLFEGCEDFVDFSEAFWGAFAEGGGEGGGVGAQGRDEGAEFVVRRKGLDTRFLCAGRVVMDFAAWRRDMARGNVRR
jgi:hypothetical protein